MENFLLLAFLFFSLRRMPKYISRQRAAGWLPLSCFPLEIVDIDSFVGLTVSKQKCELELLLQCLYFYYFNVNTIFNIISFQTDLVLSQNMECLFPAQHSPKVFSLHHLLFFHSITRNKLRLEHVTGEMICLDIHLSLLFFAGKKIKRRFYDLKPFLFSLTAQKGRHFFGARLWGALGELCDHE